MNKMDEEIEINLTPFEAAITRAAEFSDNVTQHSVWAMAANKLAAIDDPESPEGMAERFAIENVLTAIVSVPGCVTAEA